ncbi:bifunctional 4-hydroxy-2-oxoglutarate aldolase/2-dehydro-3-deoxy-phosphogluconate aldolase [Schaalia meyeri]|uniref:2-dehydro-3-deoxy-phosphogluconate aldolase n=1 Tax=Schaalia meyeri TaxID=52773 RepID=A0AAP9Y7N8_9ACTO|nr:bifunctional 4-hydroxy-2-oxoglutarate aldolase/2-dehydro-3-deoxy-phosphogluconate aldolase [Schaalia meyeri]QQC43620.1 bifunctional 4-hydroxy-2-oxoglutarate aldolase/2-dehydro-3-deoxy-phosphogluconate aldolase [Schaalia meyeri]SDR64404.1 2-dehydro-3-deoxyphosphogluconate aldolase / (4S)-4-hydroxy-2-oxoglutarate aldolase [Schaalia meyeri]
MRLDQILRANPVIPVVVVNDAQEGVDVGRALVAGGISTAEVTFRTAAAPDAIEAMNGIDGLVVGAGTVLNAHQAKRAIESGARYVVSPGFSADIVRTCQEAGVPALPGCSNASLIMAALAMGIDVVKFFPANILGGAGAIKAYSAVFPGLRFVPTGGVSPSLLPEYLRMPEIAACGGSWMVRRELVESRNWATITALSAEAVRIAKESGR